MFFQSFSITSPIVFFAKMIIAPRLVFQAVRLVGVYRGRISVPFTMGRHRFAALAALLLEPRTVIAPIALFVGAIVARRLPMPQVPSALASPAYMPNIPITPIRQATIRTIRRRRQLTRRSPAIHLNRVLRLRRAGQAATLPDNCRRKGTHQARPVPRPRPGLPDRSSLSRLVNQERSCGAARRQAKLAKRRAELSSCPPRWPVRVF